MQLEPYQQQGVEWLATKRYALLADCMGLGKTCQAITAATRIAAKRVLVLAPLATAEGWQRECALWQAPVPLVVLRRKDLVPIEPGWYFMPWTDLATRRDEIMTTPRFDLVIADEVHYTKSGPGSDIGAAMWGRWVRRNRRPTFREGVARHADRCWAMSGTPHPNGRPVEGLAMYQVFGVSVAKSRRAYIDRYCKRPNPWCPSGFDDKGAHHLDELNAILDKEIRLCRRPEDVPGQLPALRRVVVPLKGVRPPDDMGAQVSADPDTGLPIVRNRRGLPAFEEMSGYRSDLGKRKAPACIAWILDYVTAGKTLDAENRRPLVVLCHHRDVARQVTDGLRAALKDDSLVCCATGDEPAAKRQELVDHFAAGARGDPLIFVGTTPACGTGMNGLHKRTTVAVFVEGEWSPHLLDQGEGRIRRKGGIGGAEQTAIIHYLVVTDSLEDHMMRMIVEKRNNADKLSRSTTKETPMAFIPRNEVIDGEGAGRVGAGTRFAKPAPKPIVRPLARPGQWACSVCGCLAEPECPDHPEAGRTKLATAAESTKAISFDDWLMK